MPAPLPGEKWSITKLAQNLPVFSTLIGTHPAGPTCPSTPTMSAHIYGLAAGQFDQQGPHKQEELYYVLSGTRTLVLNAGTESEKRVPLVSGDLVYVPANTDHRFDGESEIVTLVFFAPDFTG